VNAEKLQVKTEFQRFNTTGNRSSWTGNQKKSPEWSGL